MRGIAHIAVLKALEEYNLKPHIISGTSAGSIIGAFYSFGKHRMK
jgi:NTE family protein